MIILPPPCFNFSDSHPLQGRYLKFTSLPPLKRGRKGGGEGRGVSKLWNYVWQQENERALLLGHCLQLSIRVLSETEINTLEKGFDLVNKPELRRFFFFFFSFEVTKDPVRYSNLPHEEWRATRFRTKQIT